MPEPAILDDITVLDCSTDVSGAYCTKLLAGLGARVIKIEPPEGDPARTAGPFRNDSPNSETSALFLYLNTGKQGITLNTTTSDGRELLSRLITQADVLVDNAGGAHYDNLIHCSVTPFGQTGPYRDYQATELILEALGALLYSMGLPEREPLKLGGNPSLMAGGVSAFSAIMLALHQRDLTGEGQFIDVSLLESTLMTQIHATIYSQAGNYDHPRRPAQLSRAKDGWMNVGIQDASWKEFCDLIQRPDLIADPRFVDMAARREHAEALNDVLNEWLKDQDKVEAYHTLQALRSIAGYVADASELFDSAQFKAREFFQQLDHPNAGPLLYPGAPFRIADEPWRQSPAPLLGEHNIAIYHRELGISKEDLVRLRELGAI